jgi:uncharacterized membrane protein
VSATQAAGARLRGREPLAAVAGGAIVLALATVLPQPARALVGFPVALLLPGYALLLASFGEARERDGAMTAALSAILSIALYPLVALLLFILSIRLSTTSVLVSTEVLTLVLAVVAALRLRSRPTVAEAPAARAEVRGTVLVGVLGGIPLLRLRAARAADALPVPSSRLPGSSVWRGARGGALFVGLVAAACGVVALGLHVFPGAPPDSFTQLYLTRAAHDSGKPLVGLRGHTVQVRVTVANHSSTGATYRLAPSVRGSRTWHARTITVAAQGTWSGSVKGAVPAGGCLHRLLIDLREGGSSVGSLTLWLQSSARLPKACQP